MPSHASAPARSAATTRVAGLVGRSVGRPGGRVTGGGGSNSRLITQNATASGRRGAGAGRAWTDERSDEGAARGGKARPGGPGARARETSAIKQIPGGDRAVAR